MFHNIGTVVLKMDIEAEQWKNRQKLSKSSLAFESRTLEEELNLAEKNIKYMF
jgi:hypothetical protein